MFKIKSSNKLEITVDKKFYLRNTRKILSKKKFFYNKLLLKKVQNQPVMFVRAPKHFKSGKQHVFFFETISRKTIKISCYNFIGPLLMLPAAQLHSFAVTSLSEEAVNDVRISRVTYSYEIFLKFKKWLVFFFYK